MLHGNHVSPRKLGVVGEPDKGSKNWLISVGVSSAGVVGRIAVAVAKTQNCLRTANND